MCHRALEQYSTIFHVCALPALRLKGAAYFLFRSHRVTQRESIGEPLQFLCTLRYHLFPPTPAEKQTNAPRSVYDQDGPIGWITMSFLAPRQGQFVSILQRMDETRK